MKTVYAIAIIVMIYLILVETSDWSCSEGPYFCMIKCTGEPCTFTGTTPNESDSIDTLLTKISKSGETDGKSVKWRRAMIIAISIVLVISIFVLGDVKDFGPKSFSLCILIGFFLSYLLVNFFTFHYNSGVERNINISVDILREKLKLDKENE